MMRKFTIAVVLVAFIFCTQVQAQTPEIDALRERAEQGDAEAQHNLGSRHATGRGGPRDDDEVVRWWRLAGDQGFVESQRMLGNSYVLGTYVSRDYAEAARWYRLAAEQGDASAQHSIGQLYEAGIGVPEDYVQAYMWFNLAASRLTGDNREAVARQRDDLAARMTPERIAEAQRLASEWDAAHPREP